MHTINMIITNENNNWYYYIKVQLIKRIVKAFGNASNLKKKKKKVRLGIDTIYRNHSLRTLR